MPQSIRIDMFLLELVFFIETTTTTAFVYSYWKKEKKGKPNAGKKTECNAS